MFTSDNLLVVLLAIPIYQLIFFTIQAISFKWSANRPRFMLGILLLIMTFILIINAIHYMGYNVTFSYPQAGLNELASKMAERCNIHYKKQAISIDTNRKLVFFLEQRSQSL